MRISQDIFPAGSSGLDGPCPRHSFPSDAPNGLRLTRDSSYGGPYGGHLGREDLVQPALAQPHSTRTTSTRPSAAMAFLQRTIARLRRQPKQTPLSRKGPTGSRAQQPLSDLTPRLAGRDGFTSLTRLVLHSTDDVSFSPSSFFRRVEEVSALNACSEAPLAPSLPPPPFRPPPARPRRRPPPPVDETTARTTTTPRAPSSLSPKHSSTRAQKTPRKPLVKREFDSLLELQALATELDKLDPFDSPPLAQHQLHASPSIKSTRPCPPLWSASPPAALGYDRDPLTELLAVAEELKTMKNLDSDDILYMTDAPPLSPLPPTLHAFLDAPGASLHILEMDVHKEDETFLGVPIPCIVVTSEGETLPVEVLAMQLPRPSPSEDLLAPPPTTYRGRMATDQPPVITDDDPRERHPPSGSAPSSSSPCEGVEDLEDLEASLSLPCSSANVNLSWEVISDMVNSSSQSNRSSKPDRPTAPKPAPLLRRRERSLLRRILGSGGHIRAPSAGKDKLQHVPSSKRERIRIPKEAIGSPLPLSPAS
ncbi:hypothetical protein BJV78DRAFT_1175158 [Lactifluus subvellereus]|nr:hypothetical protein BJV78DRAFT_1175158 [Lactifluus subvellereus]